MARRIFEPSVSSDTIRLIARFYSLATLMAIFSNFWLIFYMILSPDEIDVLPMVEPRSFAVSANFKLKPLFYNLILKFLLRTRPPQYGTTTQVKPLP